MLLAWVSLGASLSWGGDTEGTWATFVGLEMVGFAPKNGGQSRPPPRHVVPWGRRDVGEDGSQLQDLISCPDEETRNRLK